MTTPTGAPRKPQALRKGSKIAVFAPASPAEQLDVTAGLAELRRLGYEFTPVQLPGTEGYFAASTESRREGFLKAVRQQDIAGLMALRGGYGANYLLEKDLSCQLLEPKCVAWVQRPHFAAMLSVAGMRLGYLSWTDGRGGPESRRGRRLRLRRALLFTGGREFSVRVGDSSRRQEHGQRGLGGTAAWGCLTLLQTTLGTPWEIKTAGTILVLEDRGMRPYQVDRALMHLKQAGKLQSLEGIVLGEFPDSEPPVKSSPTVQDVCERILGPLGVPIVFGTAVGHTQRPMLTLPLGIQARLIASGTGRLEILEPAVVQ